jgi:DNA-binding response OmpR family regulator
VEGQSVVVVAAASPELLELVAGELAQRGYEAITAADGRAALDTIRERRPAAAVLDWVMPVMQGPRVCRLLKDDPATAAIPVVLLTARASERDISAAFAEGADDYLTKPFAIDELEEMLQRLIEKAR